MRATNDNSIRQFREADAKANRAARRAGAYEVAVNGYAAFEDIQRITASAALVMAAEYDRLRSLADTPMHAINLNDWGADVRRDLTDLGFLKLFQIFRSDERHSDPYILQFETGERIEEETAGFIITSLAEMVFGAGDDEKVSETRGQLISQSYRGLIEAMENVRQHAYPPTAPFSREIEEVPRWWMTGAYDQANEVLTIVLYDMGVTIPVSLPKWPGWGRLRPILERAFRTSMPTIDDGFDDAAIYAATHMGRSSTFMTHRGKGLPAMREILDQCRWGSLRIVSRRGDVVFEKDQRPRRILRRNALRGTLVEWKISL